MGFTSQNVPVRELEKILELNSSSKTYGRLKSMIRYYSKFVFFFLQLQEADSKAAHYYAEVRQLLVVCVTNIH